MAHRVSRHADAEARDLDFWQSQGAEERLSALVAIRRDLHLVAPGRTREDDSRPDLPDRTIQNP